MLKKYFKSSLFLMLILTHTINASTKIPEEELKFPTIIILPEDERSLFSECTCPVKVGLKVTDILIPKNKSFLNDQFKFNLVKYFYNSASGRLFLSYKLECPNPIFKNTADSSKIKIFLKIKNELVRVGIDSKSSYLTDDDKRVPLVFTIEMISRTCFVSNQKIVSDMVVLWLCILIKLCKGEREICSFCKMSNHSKYLSLAYFDCMHLFHYECIKDLYQTRICQICHQFPTSGICAFGGTSKFNEAVKRFISSPNFIKPKGLD